MNEHRLKGSWKQVKGKVKEQWGRLTDDDVTEIDGRMDQLIGRIQRRYGRSKDEAQREVDNWRSTQNL